MGACRGSEALRTVNIGLVGCGTVGGGFVHILEQHAADFERQYGVSLALKAATSRTKSKLVAKGVPEAAIVDSYRDIVADPDIDIVVELIGGTTVAADVVLEALACGKNVMTANKALLASRGADVLAAAAENGVELCFEAAVGGGIPIIQPLKHALTGNAVSSVLGIVNGTTNYMLTRMADDGLDYAAALAEAQALGYAEADPTADVGGFDAAAKIAILASIAFHSRVTLDDVYTEGIERIEPVDFVYADEMGYAIKLLAIAHRLEDGIDVRVHPTLIPKGHQLAAVNGVYNAIYVTGDAVGDCMFFGEGAGAGPAASAVMGDCIELARHIAAGTGPLESCTCTDELPIRPMGLLTTKYCLRLIVADEPGVLASITDVFARCNVSIHSMTQPSARDGRAELIFMTHAAREADIFAALELVESLASVSEVRSVIRIEED